MTEGPHECRLSLEPSGAAHTFPEGTPLGEALLDMDVDIRTPCGGKGTCGKCRIQASGGLSQPTAQEERMVADTPGFRLACQAKLLGDTQVRLDERAPSDRRPYPVVDPHALYAAAVDIGTTTVKMSLVDTTTGACHDLDAFLNPQRRYGHDVISRIAAATDPDKAKRQSSLIRHAVLNSLGRACTHMGLPSSAVTRIMFSGNTTMLTLLFGLDATPLGCSPYTAPDLDFDRFSPADIEARMFPQARISTLPALSAFLGGDLMGGLAVCQAKGLKRSVFFIDLGTNGELFLCDPDGNIFAASCAMGPALEGMNISCGMSADEGAITHVHLKEGRLVHEMLGPGKPVGIAGTALIDILALFLKRGIITPQGALTCSPLPTPARYRDDGLWRRIELWNDIGLTQQDVRNVQLAKAATMAAGRLLLKASGCSADAVEHVVIAGAIGQHLYLDHFRTLGFIPDFPKAKYRYLGNTSLMAAQCACIDDAFLPRVRALRKSVSEVGLAGHPDFEREFLKAMAFEGPEADR